MSLGLVILIGSLLAENGRRRLGFRESSVPLRRPNVSIRHSHRVNYRLNTVPILFAVKG